MRTLPFSCYCPPWSNPKQRVETRSSLILRISAITLGIITLAASVAAFYQVAPLHTLSMAGKAALFSISSSIIFAGLSLRYYKPYKKPFESYDSSPPYSPIHPPESVMTLKQFIDQKPQVIERLKHELNLTQLPKLPEDFTVSINPNKDEEQLLETLKLIYGANDFIFSQRIRSFTMEQKNILCYRLMHLPVSQKNYEEGTVGAFRQKQKELDKVDQNHYLFFTQKQINVFLNNHQQLDADIIGALFPVAGEEFHFIRSRNTELLKKLPNRFGNKVLPFLDGTLLTPIIQERRDLNYSRLTEEQVRRMLPLYPDQQFFLNISIRILNQIMPKMMAAHRFSIPEVFLKNSQLNLQSLTEEQIRDLFILIDDSSAQKRINCLHEKVFKQIQKKLGEDLKNLRSKKE